MTNASVTTGADSVAELPSDGADRASSPAMTPGGAGEEATYLSQTAEAIAELEARAIAICRGLEEDIPEEVWTRHDQGDRGVFIRRIAQPRDGGLPAEITRRYGEDLDFHAQVDSYVAAFEALLANAQGHGMRDVLNATFVSSDMGRAYVVLARAIGRV